MEFCDVSVVMPAFNHGAYIERALNSVFAQSLPPMQVFVVDDGSTDDTRQRLAAFSGRIKYIYQPNAGPAAARNQAIRRAHGRWIALIDADDEWRPEKLALQMDCAKQFPKALAIGAAVEGGMTSESGVSRLELKDFFGPKDFGVSGSLILRTALNEIGLFNPENQRAEDLDVWLRLASRGEIVRINRPVWTYHRHEGQIHRDARAMTIAHRRVLSAFFRDYGLPAGLDLNKVWAFFHYVAAEAYAYRGRHERALRYLRLSYARSLWGLSPKHDPRRARLLLSLRCLFGEERISRWRPYVRALKRVLTFWNPSLIYSK